MRRVWAKPAADSAIRLARNGLMEFERITPKDFI